MEMDLWTSNRKINIYVCPLNLISVILGFKCQNVNKVNVKSSVYATSMSKFQFSISKIEKQSQNVKMSKHMAQS